ncbi:MAG: hypothetical protein IIC13_14230 [SAR324 cluster bacterium]|nr:hypothetical protein [SAR324 cluster bacterium]
MAKTLQSGFLRPLGEIVQYCTLAAGAIAFFPKNKFNSIAMAVIGAFYGFWALGAMDFDEASPQRQQPSNLLPVFFTARG